MHLILELALDDESILVFFIVTGLEITIRDKMSILCDVYGHEVATLAFGWLEFDTSGFLNQYLSLVSGYLEVILHVFKVARMTLEGLSGLIK